MEQLAQNQWDFNQGLYLRDTVLLFLSWSTTVLGASSWAGRQIYLLHNCKAIPGGWSSASWQGGHLAACRQEGYIHIDNTVGSNSSVTLLFFVINIHTFAAAGLTQYFKGRQWAGYSLETWTVFGIGWTLQFDLNGMTCSCVSPGTEQGIDYDSQDHGPSLSCPLPCQHLPAALTFSFGLLIPAGQCGGSELGNITAACTSPLTCRFSNSCWVESLIHSQNISIHVSICLYLIYLSIYLHGYIER